MKIQDLKPNPKSKFRAKKIGRGNGSGHGTYSTRGMNGQGQRSGYHQRPGFEGGQTPLIRKLPKLRGFMSIYERPAIFNLDFFNKKFKEGDNVTKKVLFERGMLASEKTMLKILGNGELKKKLTIEADKFSQSAKEKIEKIGGKAIIIGSKEKQKTE